MVHKVSIFNYGQYSSQNYGSSRAVTIGDLTLYFSYDTVVAFRDVDTGLVISENIWSTTTGKHLNAINPNKKLRIPREQFKVKLGEVLKKHNLEV